MDYLLHIDTSADTGTVAIGADGVLVAQRTNTETRNHAATINIMISEVLAHAGISLEQLSGIVVCAGPGSYTGLRIGLSTAKGLCYALDIPLLLDNRLTLLAYQAYKTCEQQASKYVALLSAREKEYFIAVYDKLFLPVVEPQHIMEKQLAEFIQKEEKTCVITDTPDIIKSLGITDIQINNNIQINFNLWVSYGFEQFKCNNIVNLSTSEPFYLKQVYTHK